MICPRCGTCHLAMLCDICRQKPENVVFFKSPVFFLCVFFTSSRFLSTRRHPPHPVSPLIVYPFRLILTRSQFRALDFRQVANRNVVRASGNMLFARNLMRRYCSGHLYVCSCDSAARFLDSETQANIDYCYVWRCTLRASNPIFTR